MILVVLLTFADPTTDARVRQQEVVEAAAAAVASARADGARRRDVADLMAHFRTEAEQLAAMTPPDPIADPGAVHTAALFALADATANGRVDRAARQVVTDWLGPLGARLALLDGALAAATTAAARTPDLARSMALDVEGQCTAVMLAAAHDATEADSTARSARLTAAALRGGAAPRESGGVGVEMDIRAAEAAASRADAVATAAWELRARAAALRTRARRLLGMEVEP